MIRLVELKNWRAYEDAAIDLGSKNRVFCRSQRRREVLVDGGGAVVSAWRASNSQGEGRSPARCAVGNGHSGGRASANRIRHCASNDRSTPAGRATFAASLDGGHNSRRQVRVELLARQVEGRSRADRPAHVH